MTEEEFEERFIPEEKKHFGSHMTDDYIITAVYDPSVKYRLVEEYGPESFTVMEDGRLYTEWGFTDSEEAVFWFLGFGDRVTVTGPQEMVEKIRATIQKTAEKYETSTGN